MKGPTPRVTVVGSLVMDLVFRAERRPRPGETLLGNGFEMFLGGKGFNQAIGCRRLGAEVTMVGRVGRDRFGQQFLEQCRSEAVDAEFVFEDAEAGTGVASPVIFADGQNSIIGVPRANMRLTTDDVDAAEDRIARSDVLMLQFEVTPAASKRAAEIARRHGTTVLLDPAPVHGQAESREWPIDYLVPNEVEAAMLTKGGGPEEWGRTLLDSGVRAVVISLGARGALAVSSRGVRELPALPVDVLDSTGAGDAFRAGLAVRLAEGATTDDAVRFANACGALACTVLGAEPSMPTRAAVESLLAGRERAR